jgi:hypothetical protein
VTALLVLVGLAAGNTGTISGNVPSAGPSNDGVRIQWDKFYDGNGNPRPKGPTDPVSLDSFYFKQYGVTNSMRGCPKSQSPNPSPGICRTMTWRDLQTRVGMDPQGNYIYEVFSTVLRRHDAVTGAYTDFSVTNGTSAVRTDGSFLYVPVGNVVYKYGMTGGSPVTTTTINITPNEYNFSLARDTIWCGTGTVLYGYACSRFNGGSITQDATWDIGSGSSSPAFVAWDGSNFYVCWSGNSTSTFKQFSSARVLQATGTLNIDPRGLMCRSSTGFKVLIAAAESNLNLLADTIFRVGAGAFSVVDYQDVRSPSIFRPADRLAAGYRVVVAFGDGTPHVGFGDSLARFEDLGGKVVVPCFGDYPGMLTGRWAARYQLWNDNGSPYNPGTLGTVYQPSHPIMQGVSTIASNTFTTSSTVPKVSPYVARIADWNTGGRLECVTYDSLGFRVVYLGFFPCWWINQTLTGQGILQLVNAIKWAEGGSPMTHDVGCTRILAPSGQVDSNTVVTPACSLYNYGTAAESYAVRMKIGAGYNQTVQITSHAAGARIYQTFPAWTALPRGALAVSCSTELSGDATPSNDRQTGTVTVRVLDAQTVSIDAPVGTVSQGTIVTPLATVRNNGTLQSFFDIYVEITPAYNSTRTCTLNAGASAQFSFANWTAGPAGTQTVKCSTRLVGDLVRANDKLTGQVVVLPPARPDIAVTAIVIPDTVEYCQYDTALVWLQNYGGMVAQPGWWVRFDVLNPDQTHYLDSVQITDTLGANQATTRRFIWHPPTPSHHLITVTATYNDTALANNVLHRDLVVKSLDVEVNRLSIDPPGRPFQVCTWHWIDVGVHNKSEHLWEPTLYNVPIVVTVTRPSGSMALLDTIIAPRLPYCSTRVFLSDSFHLDSAGIWRIHAEVIVPGDNVPGNNYKDSVITVTVYQQPADSGWVQKASLPAGSKGKNIKDGGCLAYKPDSTGEYVYALKGNGRCEFYRYSIEDNVWQTKESIPAVGRSGKKKAVKKGATIYRTGGLPEGSYGDLLAAKGNGTTEWWQYDPALSGTPTYPWSQKADIPLGAKACKEGCGAASVVIGDTGFVYFLKGSGTQEFYRYNTVTDAWTAMANAPTGTSGKPFKNGSALCASLDGSTVYAIKGSYNELYAYDVGTNVWITKRPLPFTGSSGKKKKVKDGAGIAYKPDSTGEYVYALKGGGTYEFWQWNGDSDQWTQMTDIPAGSGKPVKGGGALTAASNALYAFKGNNTLDFFRYGFSAYGLQLTANSENEMSSGRQPSAVSRLLISPNPFSNTTTIRYTLPKAGNASLKLYDVTGQLVTTFASGYHSAGNYSCSAPTLARGIYVLKLATDGTSATRKLIVE